MKPEAEYIVRVVAKRDSATSILRKMGIQTKDYDFYIEKLDSKKFVVHIEKAEIYLKSLKKAMIKLAEVKLGDPITEHKIAVKAAAAIDNAVKSERISCSSVAKSLILAGKTNQEVWDVISKQFKLDATKKHYPTWYRCQLKRLAKKAS